MTTTTTPHPDVPLPPGALADSDSWEFWGNEFRTFHGVERIILDAAGRKIGEVCTGGVQFPDGSIDTTECPPTVDVYTGQDGITSAQARELAAMLVEAAAEIDGWTR